MAIEVKIDASKALAKLDKVTPNVRNALNAVIPELTKELAALVSAKMASELKSQDTLTVTQQIGWEGQSRVFGRVGITSPSAGGLLPTYLEEGTRPHEIIGNPILAFYWDRVGGMAFFRHVNHPGTKAYQFLERSMDEMSGLVKSEISEAVKAGVRS